MFESLLEKIGAALDSAGVAYMIIGGQAVLLYGEPRLTRDIDITLGVSTDRLNDILGLLKRLHMIPLVVPETFTVRTMVLPCQDPTTGIRVDFIFSFSPYERIALKRVRAVRIGDTLVKFASPEDLIIHKIFAGRARDLEDVKAILSKNPSLDFRYVRKWLKRFSKDLGEAFLERFEHLLL